MQRFLVSFTRRKLIGSIIGKIQNNSSHFKIQKKRRKQELDFELFFTIYETNLIQRHCSPRNNREQNEKREQLRPIRELDHLFHSILKTNTRTLKHELTNFLVWSFFGFHNKSKPSRRNPRVRNASRLPITQTHIAEIHFVTFNSPENQYQKASKSWQNPRISLKVRAIFAKKATTKKNETTVSIFVKTPDEMKHV